MWFDLVGSLPRCGDCELGGALLLALPSPQTRRGRQEHSTRRMRRCGGRRGRSGRCSRAASPRADPPDIGTAGENGSPSVDWEPGIRRTPRKIRSHAHANLQSIERTSDFCSHRRECNRANDGHAAAWARVGIIWRAEHYDCAGHQCARTSACRTAGRLSNCERFSSELTSRVTQCDDTFNISR